MSVIILFTNMTAFLGWLCAGLVVSARYVNYGSHLELTHKATGHALFSLTKVQWGSGGQIVSAIPPSLKSPQLESTSWIVRSAPPASRILSDQDVKYFSTGNPESGLGTAFSGRPSGSRVHCGDEIRLEHSESTRVLKGNSSPSLVGGGFEVVASGAIDDDDVFIVECPKAGADGWEFDAPIVLKHKNYNGYLSTNKKALFTQQNCPRCPIKKHTDVHISTRASRTSDAHHWIAASVMAVSLNEDELEDDETFHDEL